MILESLLKSQGLAQIAKKIKKSRKEVWDIGIYGSVVRGKREPNDLDLVIFLTKGISVEERLSLSQNLREDAKGIIKNVNVEAVSLEDFFDSNLMEREGILAESYLLIQKKYLSEILGFKTFSVFRFGLIGLSNSQKTVFRYAINGRRGQTGILKEVKGEKIGSGAVKVPIESSERFKEFLETHKIKYKTETSMFYLFK